MSVDSYLDLYTTLFGWVLYNNVWDILVGTGIAFIPFFGMIITHFVQPMISQEARDASTVSLRRMEVSVFIAMFVIIMAGQPNPLTPLTPGILSYQQPCSATTGTVGSTGTGYDATFASISASTPNVPVWWYAIMSVSGAVTRTAIISIPCVNDLRLTQLQINNSKIEDAELYREVVDFSRDCYVPAKSKYLREKPNASAILSTYGSQDTEWMGSRVFSQMPGYYDIYRATRPVKGWAYDPARDTEYSTAPTAGRPICRDWWGNATAGLKQKLVGIVEPSAMSNLMAWFTGTPSDVIEDNAIKSALQWNTTQGSLDNQPAFVSYTGGPADSNLSALFGNLGVAWEGLSYYPKMHVLRNALPIVQSFILMMIFILLPFVVVASRYTLEMMVLGGLVVFTIKFWSFLWHVSWWIDNNLIAGLYPGEFLFLNNNSLDGKIDLINMLTVATYLAFPLIFTMLMGLAGYGVFKGIGSITNSLVAGSAASSAGAGFANKLKGKT